MAVKIENQTRLPNGTYALTTYQGKSGNWTARRVGEEGHGKTKKLALQDLNETILFKNIAAQGKK